MKSDQIKMSIKQLNQPASEDLDHRVHKGIDHELAQTQHTQTTHIEPLRRSIMKHPGIKIAAAAVIVFAVILGFNPFGTNNITFAQVIEPLLNFNTIMLDFISGEEGSGAVVHDVVKGNRIRRTISNMDSTMILDLDAGKMLLLNADKSAAYVDIQGTVEQGTRELLDMVRSIVSKVEENPEIVVQELGIRDFGGIETVGFEVKDAHATIRLWADPATATPKRIELNIGKYKAILKNIEFDVPVLDNEVSMDVPQGYQLVEHPIAINEPTEQDLIATLGLWAEHINGGTFPDAIGVQELMTLQPDVVTALGKLEGSEQEKTDRGMQYGRTVIFVQLLTQRGELHYAGQGVALGASDKAVLWYRMGDTKTYRVIYGDLHVEEVALDLLPQ